MDMQRLGGSVVDGGGGWRGSASKEFNKKGERCGSGSKRNRGEQMGPCSAMTDRTLLRHNQTKSKRNAQIMEKCLGLDKPRTGAAGLTHKSWFCAQLWLRSGV